MTVPRPGSKAREGTHGMALVAVLWIVAFLSVIASGLTRSIRLESRAMAMARQEVEAQAMGDGAIQVALQALVANPQPVRQLLKTEVTYRGTAMSVHVMPLNGLIDINSAGQPLLERLFSVAGGLPPQAAQAAAQAVLEARTQRAAQGRRKRLEAPEDLLQIPGIDYDLYARLAPLLTADLDGSGRVNPLSAPAEVLAVLAGGNAQLAAQIATSRDSGAIGIDTSSLDAALIDNATTTRLRIQALVPMADGAVVSVSRAVDMRGRASDGAPWLTFGLATAVMPVPRKDF